MKHTFTPILMQLKQDRPLLLMVLAVLIVGLLYSLLTILSLEPTDLQVAVRYSAFGEVQYYRDQWFYLLSFVGLGLVTAGIHIAMIIKLHARNMRSISLGYGWLSLLLFVIMFFITSSVLGIAYLS